MSAPMLEATAHGAGLALHSPLFAPRRASLARALIGAPPDADAADAAALDRLSRRERQVLELMACGRTNAAIGRSLVVTPKAVEKHVGSIFAKLGLPASSDDHRRVLAVLRFLRAARTP